MPKGLYGKTLSPDLGFLTPSSYITGFNSITRLLEGIVVNWVLRIGIPLSLIPRGMDKSKLLIRS